MLIVALYMNDVPAPSTQVIVPNAQRTFLLGWKPDYRAITHHTVHSQSNSMRPYLGFPNHLVKGNIYGSHFSSLWSLKFLSRACIFPATSFPVFCLLGTRLWHQVTFPRLSLHRGPGLKGRACSLNLSPGVWSLWGNLVGVYERPCPMLYLLWYLHLFLDKPAHVPCSLTTRSWRA